MKKWILLLKKLISTAKLHRKLRRMDSLWYKNGGNHYELFPPSFYHTHENAAEIAAEEIKELQDMLAEYDAKHDIRQNTHFPS